MKKYSLILLTTIALGACSSDDPGGEVPAVKEIELTPHTRAANESLNKFAFDFFNASAEVYDKAFSLKEDGNFSVSPLSASLALGLLANSADEVCTAQVLKALSVDDLETLNTTCNSLLCYLAWQERGEVLELANSVWYSQTCNVLPEYLNVLSDKYYAKAEGIDFTNESEALNTINSWAKSKTHGLIPQILTMMPSNTLFVLANAMYYKGRWKEPFLKHLTEKKYFEGTSRTASVDMMHNSYEGMFYTTDLAQAVSVPFARNTRLMVLLPDENITAQELSKEFDSDAWNKLLASRERCLIHLDLPKFKVASSANLVPVFERLGISRYVRTMAKMGIDEDVELLSIQRISTAIDEDGAEVVATTVITGEVMAPPPAVIDGEVTFTVDKPFLYFIYDYTTGTVLMAGRICNM